MRYTEHMEDFHATLAEDSPRYPDWLKVYGCNEVILKHPLPAIGEFPEVGVKEFYELDLQSLDIEQRARLIAHIAERFHYSEDEVNAELDKVGCPILADDVIVTIFHPQRWL